MALSSSNSLAYQALCAKASCAKVSKYHICILWDDLWDHVIRTWLWWGTRQENCLSNRSLSECHQRGVSHLLLLILKLLRHRQIQVKMCRRFSNGEKDGHIWESEIHIRLYTTLAILRQKCGRNMRDHLVSTGWTKKREYVYLGGWRAHRLLSCLQCVVLDVLHEIIYAADVVLNIHHTAIYLLHHALLEWWSMISMVGRPRWSWRPAWRPHLCLLVLSEPLQYNVP